MIVTLFLNIDEKRLFLVKFRTRLGRIRLVGHFSCLNKNDWVNYVSKNKIYLEFLRFQLWITTNF